MVRWPGISAIPFLPAPMPCGRVQTPPYDCMYLPPSMEKPEGLTEPLLPCQHPSEEWGEASYSDIIGVEFI